MRGKETDAEEENTLSQNSICQPFFEWKGDGWLGSAGLRRGVEPAPRAELENYSSCSEWNTYRREGELPQAKLWLKLDTDKPSFYF